LAEDQVFTFRGSWGNQERATHEKGPKKTGYPLNRTGDGSSPIVKTIRCSFAVKPSTLKAPSKIGGTVRRRGGDE